MGFHPLLFRLDTVPVLVAGGGNVSTRRALLLADAGAAVTVVSPQISAELKQAADDGVVSVILREYRSGDVAGFRIVVAGTDSAAVNRTVTEDAKHAGAWVNCADSPEDSDFWFPAVCRTDEVTVAVSSNDGSPKKAQQVRDAVIRMLGS